MDGEGAATGARAQSYTASRLRSGPPVRSRAIRDDELDQIVAEYVHITGDKVSSARKRGLIAAVARLHGHEMFIQLVAKEFTRTGTSRDLLGVIRLMSPASDEWDLDAIDGEEPSAETVDRSPRQDPPEAVRPQSTSQADSDVLFSDEVLGPLSPAPRRRTRKS